MFSRNFIRMIFQHEISLGFSHKCLVCGSIFLAHSDGCPKCGNYARTKLLNQSVSEEVRDGDIEGWYLLREEGLIYVALGENSPWPRIL